MFAKKPASLSRFPVSRSSYRQELEALYARRSVINSLIDSLEDYDRHRETRLEREKADMSRKTA